MAEKDLYGILGVSKSASTDDIKKAYRRLAKRYHPDRNPGAGARAAEEKFKDISVAHDVLADPKKRAAYDEFGEAALREGFDVERARAARAWSGRRGGAGFPDGFDAGESFDVGEGFGGARGFGDLFGEFFGGRRGGRRARVAMPGADAEASLTVDFLDAVRGREMGIDVGNSDGKTRHLKVKIPPGVSDGQKIRLLGLGAPGVGGGPPGDLYVLIHVRPHAFYTREGDDLLLQLPVTVGEAYRGGKVRCPTPWGDVTLTVPPRSQSGTQLRVRGKGAARAAGGNGDLLATLVVQLPEADSAALRAAVDAIETHYPGDVRRNLVDR